MTERFYSHNLSGGTTGIATLFREGDLWKIVYGYGTPWGGGVTDDGSSGERLFTSRNDALAWLRQAGFETGR